MRFKKKRDVLLKAASAQVSGQETRQDMRPAGAESFTVHGDLTLAVHTPGLDIPASEETPPPNSVQAEQDLVAEVANQDGCGSPLGANPSTVGFGDDIKLAAVAAKVEMSRSLFMATEEEVEAAGGEACPICLDSFEDTGAQRGNPKLTPSPPTPQTPSPNPQTPPLDPELLNRKPTPPNPIHEPETRNPKPQTGKAITMCGHLFHVECCRDSEKVAPSPRQTLGRQCKRIRRQGRCSSMRIVPASNLAYPTLRRQPRFFTPQFADTQGYHPSSYQAVPVWRIRTPHVSCRGAHLQNRTPGRPARQGGGRRQCR